MKRRRTHDTKRKTSYLFIINCVAFSCSECLFFLAVKIVKNKESSLAEKEEVILKPKETNLDQANELVSGYYYDKALELLETDSSEKATELKARINELVKTSVHWDDPGKIPICFSIV